MTRVIKTPTVCACGLPEQTPWHCECRRWKSAGVERCEVCDPAGQPVMVEHRTLSIGQVQQIREMYAAGTTASELGTRFGYRTNYIYAIVGRRKWWNVA